MLWHYEVPQIAAHKMKRAKEHAFLQHWTSKLAKMGKPLTTRMDDLELHELTQLQLYQLLELVMCSSTASDQELGHELGVGSREMFDKVFKHTHAPQTGAKPASSEQPLPPLQSPECSQSSTALPGRQTVATLIEEAAVQVGKIQSQVLACDQSNALAAAMQRRSLCRSPRHHAKQR